MKELEDRLDAIASADPRELYADDDKGAMLSPRKWPDRIAQAISSISENNMGGKNIRFHDKARATEQLAKIRGLYKNEEKSKNPFEEILTGIPREQLVIMVAHLRRMGAIVDPVDKDDEDDA